MTDALVVLPDPMLLTQRRQLAELAARGKRPAIYGIPEYAKARGLMVHAASRNDLFRLAASYVDRILRGARPPDLPVEQPTKFELAINPATARALGPTIPQALLLRADDVIR